MDRKQRIYNFIKELWFLIKLFVEVPPNDDNAAWDDIVEQASNLGKKYAGDDPESRMFKSFILTWLDYLNERNKESMQKNREDR